MVLSEGQRNTLNIIAELTDRTLTTSVHDTAVAERSGLPLEEVNRYLGQLEGLDYITRDIKMSGASSRLITMTREGLQASSQNEDIR